MPSPFPGMDPYLEGEGYFWGFRLTLLVAIVSDLTKKLPAGYYADIDLVKWPDRGPPLEDEFKEACRKLTRRPHKFIKIAELETDRVVTVLEVLSPSNKAGEDRDQYLLKRAEVFAAKVNLVELDLLRDGERMPFGKPKPPAADYYALVCRGGQHPKASVWAWTVRDPLPVLPVPLKPADGDIALDVRPSLDRAYEDAGYRTRIRYDQPPESPLRVADAKWATDSGFGLAPPR